MRIIGAGTREGEVPTLHETFWTVPNLITAARFALVPVFVWLVAVGHDWAAFWVLVVLGSTDWIDGYLARRFDQASVVGQWLDPLADRLSLIIVTLTLVIFSDAPLWVLLVIVGADMVLFLNASLLFGGSPELPVSVLGKLRTAALLVAAPLVLLGRTPELRETAVTDAGVVLLALGGIMHMGAALDYLLKARAKAVRLRRDGIEPRDRARWSTTPAAPAPPSS
ncbi:MAG: CDP-alcohol phosphatidyltransferase family protein [Nesterenkonia sp.]|uniref:CDP-alcohol phosphatidyltransferase family protein n=1 Tax=Nesterenkonia marinintestina TaxID=2979865 RepID=UPI0021BF3351|nr:CDP-alcohol phosphatidyltransferase family protein [Nesterenkonia sp. GX14115]MDO5493892.1 CDP-alcohol phosphatidyltransferase family protein [Nesterenkonia sp.]